jgi:hypothetical protein
MRGIWHFGHGIGNVVDGDTFTGTGDLAGRSFLVVEGIGTSGLMIVETSNTWDTSA